MAFAPAHNGWLPSVLAITAPKNNADEMALGNQRFTALGMPLRDGGATASPHAWAPAPVWDGGPDY